MHQNWDYSLMGVLALKKSRCGLDVSNGILCSSSRDSWYHGGDEALVEVEISTCFGANWTKSFTLAIEDLRFLTGFNFIL